MFLDDAPPAGQRAAFQQYMQNGGAWFGFHVSAFTTDANSWSWYHNTFLGAGNFVSNTWGPTAETLRIEDRNHPSTAGLPASRSAPTPTSSGPAVTTRCCGPTRTTRCCTRTSGTTA